MTKILKQKLFETDVSNQINVSNVLNIIREKGPISRAEISKLSNLNKATITLIVEDLLKKQFVHEIGEGKSTGGRKPILVNFNSNAGYIIGLELNIGYINATLVNLSAEIQIDKTVSINTNENEIIKQIFQLIDDLKGLAPSSPLGIVGIGVGVSGIVSFESGIIISVPNAGIKNLPLKHMVEAHTGIYTIVDNDVNAAVIGEYMYGAGKGRNDLILVSNSSRGIGLGIYLNGKIYRGFDGFAGEMGHSTINMDGPRCNCGNRGCWELYASSKALMDLYAKTKQLNEPVSVAEIIELADKGDHIAITTLTQIGEYLGIGLTNIVNTFNPDMIILRGMIGQAGKWIFNSIHRTLMERSFVYSSSKVDIIPSLFDKNAVAIGSACEIIQQVFYTSE